MGSKEDWVASMQKQFPGSREDVLGFICDFSSRVAIYDVFMSGYCYYFAKMLEAAFNRGEVCWSAGRGHIVWVDEDDIAYDVGGVYYNFEQLVPIEYLGDLINDFKHMGWEYKLQCDKINEWCRANQVQPIKAVTGLWKCIPSSKLDYNSTVEQDVVKYWDKYVDQLIPHNGSVYCVEDLIERIPPSIRRCYTNSKDCVIANLESLFA